MIQIQDEILDAFARFRVPGECWQVLSVILKRNKTITFLSQFVNLTGLKRSAVHRSIHRLVSMNVILKEVNGKKISYSLNENYNSWIQVKKVIERQEVEMPEVSKGFFDFWNSYPKSARLNFELAKREWIKLNPSDELAQEIVNSLTLWIKSDQWKKDNGKYVPSAHSFLIYKRWNDTPQIKKNWMEE